MKKDVLLYTGGEDFAEIINDGLTMLIRPLILKIY